jgi:hypothetical protein
MTPVPEPAGDIRAQLAAVLDPTHPKRACFLVPGDAERLKLDGLPKGAYAAVRDEGTLVTRERQLAVAFECADSATDAFDTAMAEILGLPEAKPLMVERCRGQPELYARAVQARDAGGHVVCETFASPIGFLGACKVMAKHVPPGGQLVTIGAVIAISRRIAMRWLDV